MSILQGNSVVYWRKVYTQTYSSAKFYLVIFMVKMPFKGLEIHDFVSEGISRHLHNPQKYDATKRSLGGYISEHIILGLISNAGKSESAKATVRLTDYAKAVSVMEEPESIIDYIESRIDIDFVLNEIGLTIGNDLQVKQLFEGRRNGLERSEICKQYSMSGNEYDAANKRLSRIIMNVKKKL